MMALNEERVLKLILVGLALLFALAAVVLIQMGSTAATVTGSSPFAPITLVEGSNTGILRPGEARWFRFRADTNGNSGQVERALTLVFTPGDTPQARQVAFEIFDESQLLFFYQGSSDHMANIGAGQWVSRDGDPHTGELFWTGWLPGDQYFYLQVVNGSRSAVDYWLFTEDVARPALTDSTTAEPSPPPAPAADTAPTAPKAHTFPGQPLVMGVNQGRLEPGEVHWYTVTLQGGGSEIFQELTLTMIATPNDGNRMRHVFFEIFTAEAVEQALSQQAPPDHVGQGTPVQRDNNPLTAEQVWDGWLIKGDRYLVRVSNQADIPIDYWLITEDVYNFELTGSGM